MSIYNQRKEILEHIENYKTEIDFNTGIFEILEGDLSKHVLASLKSQLSPSSFTSAAERLCPVNILKKVVNKVSTLYSGDIERKAEQESDLDLVKHYEKQAGINSNFLEFNKGYNSYKSSVVELFEDDGEISVRTIPSNLFLPFSSDKTNPLKVTAMIKFMGSFYDGEGEKINKFWVYSDDEFMPMDSKGDIITTDLGETEGLNPYGVIPFVFVNKSKYLLVPIPDKDDYRMTVLLSVLLSDLNFSAKYMAHSIFYGVDVDSDNLHLSPDAFWNFKSNEEGKTPTVGTIKPDVSISDILLLIKEQMGMWLETKDIKSGSIGLIGQSNAASGISKMIDEADTTVNRKGQMSTFSKAENSFWRVLAKIHNEAVSSGRIRGMGLFSDPEKLDVTVVYQDQKPIMSKLDMIEEAKSELEAGLTSKRRKIKQLNPEMTDDEVTILLTEIEAEDFAGIKIGAIDGEQVDTTDS